MALCLFCYALFFYADPAGPLFTKKMLSYCIRVPRAMQIKWWHRNWSSLTQVMACCLTAPSITWTNVDLKVRSCDNHMNAISQEIHQPSITKFSLKINYLQCLSNFPGPNVLTHWGRVTHICVSKLTSISSDNGYSPGRRQAINWTNARILLIGPLGTNFNEILIEIHTFSFKKMRLKMSSGK